MWIKCFLDVLDKIKWLLIINIDINIIELRLNIFIMMINGNKFSLFIKGKLFKLVYKKI